MGLTKLASPKEELMEEIRARFHELGQRFTREREALLGVLLMSSKAWTPQELYDQTQADENVGLTTTYRTLETLTRIGFAQVFLIEGELRYRLCAPTHHHHLVCTTCKGIDEFRGCDLDLLDVGSFQATSHRIEIFGICKNCQTGATS